MDVTIARYRVELSSNSVLLPVTTMSFWRRTMSSEPEQKPARKIGADWAAVIVAGALVLLAALGALPTISFLVK
jgi:hypothetical protein